MISWNWYHFYYIYIKSGGSIVSPRIYTKKIHIDQLKLLSWVDYLTWYQSFDDHTVMNLNLNIFIYLIKIKYKIISESV